MNRLLILFGSLFLVFNNSLCGEQKSVFEILVEMPEWNRVMRDDGTTSARIFHSLSLLNERPTCELREGLEEFIKSEREKEGAPFPVVAYEKVFMVNRYVFNVPRNTSKRATPRFERFTGIPDSEDQFNILFPFDIDSQGLLFFIGIPSGYQGRSYLMIEEFDCFYKTWGRRLDAGSKTGQEPVQRKDKGEGGEADMGVIASGERSLN